MSDTLQSANLAVWRLGVCCRLAGVVRLFRVKISGDTPCLWNCVDGSDGGGLAQVIRGFWRQAGVGP